MVQLYKAGLRGNTGHAGISRVDSPVVLKKKVILKAPFVYELFLA